MRIFIIALALILNGCSEGVEHPPKSVIKELLLEKYANPSNIEYLKEGEVENLKCTRAGEVATCSYSYSYTPHTDSYVRNTEGHWEFKDSPSTPPQ